jgi:hypothetical protein
MKTPKLSLLRRLAVLAAGLFAAPALAAAPAPSAAAPDVAQWVSQNTDLAPAEVAIAGPDTVYALEPLGPKLATGEVVALVRTESVSSAWGQAHGFRSWDAHVLFDCSGGRMRVIRSATYPEPNRQGPPAPERLDDGWRSPDPREPAAKLISAACDGGYAWPLRAPVMALQPPSAARPAGSPAVEVRPAAVARSVESAAAPVAAQVAARAADVAPSTPRLAVQLGRGPFEAGARRALERARRTLGAPADDLAALTETSGVGPKRRYTALLAGFSSVEEARAACAKLVAEGQACLTRRLPQPASATLARADAQGASKPAAAPADEVRYVVQVAHGPFEAGARRALVKARGALGEGGRGLTAATELSRTHGRRRYTALLAGFSSGEEAAQACRTLLRAGQDCVTRTAAASPLRARQLTLAQLW